jgi:hypothetical protein
MFYNGFQVFFCNYFRCIFQSFICLRTCVASVAFGCFRSRSGVASPRLLLSHLGVFSSPSTPLHPSHIAEGHGGSRWRGHAEGW